MMPDVRELIKDLWGQIPEEAREAALNAPWKGTLGRSNYLITQGFVMAAESSVLPAVLGIWALGLPWIPPLMVIAAWGCWVRSAATVRRLRSAGHHPAWAWGGLGVIAALLGGAVLLAAFHVPGTDEIFPWIKPAATAALISGLWATLQLARLCSDPEQGGEKAASEL